MIEPIKAYFVHMTPSMASEWAEKYRYNRQRPVRKWRVAQYAKSMLDGTWIGGNPIQMATCNGVTVITDGQHRQLAVIESGCAQVFTVIEYTCDTDDDVARLYYKTDRGLTRNHADMFRASNLSEEIGLNPTQLNATAGAVQVLHAGFNSISGNLKLQDDDLAEAIRYYGDAAGIYWETIAGCPSFMASAMKRSCVLAVAIATIHFSTLRYGEDKVLSFWRGAVDDDGLRSSDPRKVAHTHLLQTKLSSQGNRANKFVSPEYQARYIANCFNRWVADDPFAEWDKTPSSKVFNATAPIRISGTPWNGKQ